MLMPNKILIWTQAARWTPVLRDRDAVPMLYALLFTRALSKQVLVQLYYLEASGSTEPYFATFFIY